AAQAQSREGYNGGKSPELARGGLPFSSQAKPCAKARATAAHAAAASPPCQRARCKASSASRCTGSDNALRKVVTLATSGWEARAHASRACSQAAASRPRAAASASACSVRCDFDASSRVVEAGRSTATGAALRRVSHHVTTAAIANSHNTRLASATPRQKPCTPLPCEVAVATGVADAGEVATGSGALAADGGAAALDACGTAPLTCNVRAGTLACSARSCATSHQFNVMAGSDSFPSRCGTIAKLRVRVPCNHWPLSSVLSRVWSGYTRAPAIAGSSGSGKASAGCPVALMLKVTVSGTPAVSSPFAGRPVSFNCTSRAGSQGLPAAAGAARASMRVTGAVALTGAPMPGIWPFNSAFGLLSSALGLLNKAPGLPTASRPPWNVGPRTVIAPVRCGTSAQLYSRTW